MSGGKKTPSRPFTSADVRAGISQALLTLLAAAFLAPLVWMVGMAFTHPGSAGWTLDNFAELFHRRPFGRWIANSLFVCSSQVVAVVLTSAAGGFALARYRFVGRRVVIGAMLLTLFVPFQVLLPGAYAWMLKLGWIDTPLALLVPGAVSSFGTLLYMQAMSRVPDALLEAGRLDGCSEPRLWWTVALPMVRPMTAAYTLLAFVGAWNGYLWPATVLLDESHYTLPVGLATLVGLPQEQAQPGVLMAATLLTTAPLAALFLWLQRDFVSGLATGAIKE